MPRLRRFLPTDTPAHLVERAVDRQVLFRNHMDYRAFLSVLGEAGSRYPVSLLGYCVMPNHWHLLAMSSLPHRLSRYMQWLAGTHAVQHRKVRNTVGLGHVYQDRFWSEATVDERHFFTVLRYIEANPVRAGLVARAEEWPWSSAWERMTGAHGLLAPLPAPLPDDWTELVNAVPPAASVKRVPRT